MTSLRDVNLFRLFQPGFHRATDSDSRLNPSSYYLKVDLHVVYNPLGNEKFVPRNVIVFQYNQVK